MLNVLQAVRLRVSKDKVAIRIYEHEKLVEQRISGDPAEIKKIADDGDSHAVLSALAYEDYLKPDDQRSFLDWAAQSGWQRRGELKSLQAGDGDMEGLHAVLWTRDRGPGVTEATLAFRGTRGLNWPDWHSNLHLLTRLFPGKRDYYFQLKAKLDAAVAEIHTLCGIHCLLDATGHSLGGGLAQFAAYSHPAFGFCCAFDPSPVNGLMTDIADSKVNIAVDSVVIWESGEALGGLREIWRQAAMVTSSLMKMIARHWKNRVPRLREYKFNFSKTHNSIAEHALAPLARGLHRLAKTGTSLETLSVAPPELKSALPAS